MRSRISVLFGISLALTILLISACSSTDSGNVTVRIYAGYGYYYPYYWRHYYYRPVYWYPPGYRPPAYRPPRPVHPIAPPPRVNPATRPATAATRPATAATRPATAQSRPPNYKAPVNQPSTRPSSRPSGRVSAGPPRNMRQPIRRR
jgi:hypothetical protein